MSDRDRDPIDLLARQLPSLDVTPARSEAIRARAHAELARPRHGWRARGRVVYRRAELAVVCLVALAYVAWAFQSVLVIQR